MQLGSCPTPCKNCAGVGLPILFGRYAVHYSAQSERMKLLRQHSPQSPLSAQPGGTTLQSACYGTRMLRAGYLYIHIERSTQVSLDILSAYAIHPHGYLNAINPDAPQNTKAHKACTLGSRPANASLLWVAHPPTAKKLWYLYSPDPINPAALYNTILPHKKEHMQSIDLAAWTQGNTQQPHTSAAAHIPQQLFEYAALHNPALAAHSESLLFGLMGSSVAEREWSDTGIATLQVPGYTSQLPQPYAHSPHAQRLEEMLRILRSHNAPMVVCHDPIGMGQELGHSLQTEIGSKLSAFDAQSAPGLEPHISRGWAMQTALRAQGLQNALQNNTAYLQQADQARQHYVAQAQEHQRRLAPEQRASAQRELQSASAYEQERAKQEQQQRNQAQVQRFAQLIDTERAQALLEERQRHLQHILSTQLPQLCADLLRCVRSDALHQATLLYSSEEHDLGNAWGGAALSVQLAAVLEALALTPQGQDWLAQCNLFDQSLMARMLCMNVVSVQKTLKQAFDATDVAAPLPPSVPQDAQWQEAWGDGVKLPIAYWGLMDKGLGFIEDEAVQASSAFKKLAHSKWVSSVGLIFGTRTLRVMQDGVPPRGLAAVEAGVGRMFALLSVATLKRAEQQALHDAIAKRRAVVLARGKPLKAQEIGALEQAYARATRNMHKEIGELQSSRVLKGIGGTRASSMAGVFDLFVLVTKVSKAARTRDGRSVAEAMGQTLQAMGSLLDVRAKMYEELVFKDVAKQAKGSKVIHAAQGKLNEQQLRLLRLSALRVLAGAAVVSVFWDGVDLKEASARGQTGLALSYGANILGTVSLITSTGFGVAAATGKVYAMGSITVSASTFAAIAGYIGAVIVIGVVSYQIWIKESEWETWLRDCRECLNFCV